MPRAYGTTGAQQFATAPAVGVAGATYYNTTLKTLFVSDGTSWTEVGKGASVPVRVGTNLAPNPSFEGGALTYWTANNPGVQPLVLDATSAMSGVYSLRQATKASPDAEIVSLYLTGTGDERYPCVAGQSFTFSLDVKCELANRAVQFYVGWYNGTTYLSQADVVGIADTGVAGKINRAVFTAVAPATATFASPSIIVRTMDWGNATAGEKAWLDSLNVGSATYFDGDTLDNAAYTYNWTGSPYSSTSEKWTAGGVGDSEVLIDPSEPVPIAGLPELWVDTDDDTGGVGGMVSGTWGTSPLDSTTYGVDSLRGLEVYADSMGLLRARPQIIAGNKNIADSPAGYPTGMSIMGLGQTEAVALGWGFSCTVVTFRRGSNADSVVAQYLYQNHTPQSSPPFAQYRSGNGANNPMWSAWATVGPNVIAPTQLAASLPDTYPLGLSSIAMTNNENLAGGWPGGSMWATVTTVKSGLTTAGWATQQWSRFTTDPKLQQVLSRSGNVGSGWTAWQTVMGPDTGWTNVTYEADWLDYGVVSHQAGQYRKIGDEVRLRGLIKTAVARTGITTAFVLPLGFRPELIEIFNGTSGASLVTGAASTGTAHTHTAVYQLPMRVDVNPNGNVTVNAQAGQPLSVNSWVSLSGIAFTS